MSVRQRMTELAVEVSSPDGSVRIRLDRQRGVRARIAPSAVHDHSESSLARQIEAALTSAMEGYRDKVDTVLVETRQTGKRPHPRTPLGQRLALMDRVMERVHVKARSAARYVDLEWRGEKDFTVTLDNGSLRNIGTERLSVELNSALANANRERALRMMRARQAALKAADELR